MAEVLSAEWMQREDLAALVAALGGPLVAGRRAGSRGSDHAVGAKSRRGRNSSFFRTFLRLISTLSDAFDQAWRSFRMSDTEMARKLAELDRLLNDPETRMDARGLFMTLLNCSRL